jgi:hypothetical protein
MPLMRSVRLSVSAVLGLLALALAPTGAQAKIVEIGQTSDSPAASCPADPCQAITRTSAFQVTVAGASNRGLFTAPEDGRVVGFTIRLGNPSKAQIDFFDGNFGGTAQARLSILKPPQSGSTYRLAGQSEVFKLQAYFGREAQFPLLRSLTVKRGYVVALTTATWLPALALGLDRGNAWRSSRAQGDCDKQPPPQSAQQRLGSVRGYRCLYRGARVTYRATMIATPPPNGS